MMTTGADLTRFVDADHWMFVVGVTNLEVMSSDSKNETRLVQ